MKKNIALITGGYSGEAVISYKTAATIRENLDSEKWNCYVIDITREGWWWIMDEGAREPVDKNDFSVTKDGKKTIFCAALIALHGPPGEDGKLQGYFDCLGLKYTSCDAATSALTFNKRYTVAVAAFAGIRVAKSMHLFKGVSLDLATITSSLDFPVFVKPNNGGSSLGISKVTQPQDLEIAIAKAFAEDDQVLVEEFVRGREFTIGVFRKNNAIIPLPVTEIISKNDFFDFEAKYEGASEEITPASIDATTTTLIRDTAKKVYEVFNCRGVVRIDFILNETNGEPYLLEINTVPGQSAASIVPQQVKAMGMSLSEFYSSLIEECLQ